MKENTIAIIVAGGVGSRVGLEIPKQLIPIAGLTSLEHSITAFEKHEKIDEIIVMLENVFFEKAKQILHNNQFSKISKILLGGKTRSETVQLALNTISTTNSKIIIHDAVRPLIDTQTITNCLQALNNFDAVNTAVPSADTIIEIDEKQNIKNIPKRSDMRRGQTPQAFRKHVLTKAYDLANKDPNFFATDDCSVVFKYLPKTPIQVLEGKESNIKITYPIDVQLADKLFQLKKQNTFTQNNTDLLTKLSNKVVVIFGGSSGIGKAMTQTLEKYGAKVFAYSRSQGNIDVQKRESIKLAFSQTLKQVDQIDHIVLSAGSLLKKPLTEMSATQLQESINTNLTAAFILAQESYQYLKKSKGSLLFFTSSSHTRGRANYSVYSATKAAIVNLVQALGEEWQTEQIRVNCVNPARTSTPMREKAFGKEATETLLSSSYVAQHALHIMVSSSYGQIFDVKLPNLDPVSK